MDVLSVAIGVLEVAMAVSREMVRVPKGIV